MAVNPMVAALQGQPDPAMQALFGMPHPMLQRMAGDVIEPNPMRFGPNMYTDDYWNRVSQPAGYANPAVATPLAHGYMTGKIKVLRPEGK
jgi:hypothetical protein